MDSLSSIYRTKSYLIQKKAYILLWIQLILIPVVAVAVFINLFRNQPDKLTGMIVIDIVFILSMIAGIVFLMKGRYSIAVYINVIFVTFLTLAGHYSKWPVQAETGFNSFSIVIYPAIIFAALFARRFVLLLVSLFFIIMTIALYLPLAHAAADPIRFYLTSAVINIVAAIIMTGCLSYMNSLITDQSLVATELELERNKEFSKMLERKVEELSKIYTKQGIILRKR